MHPWLCVTSEENWNVVKSKRMWCVAEKDREKLKGTDVGEFLVLYIKQKRKNDITIRPRIKGIFKIASKPFYSEERIFSGIEIYPWRVRINPIAIPRAPLEFMKLVPRLQFIKNKEKWYSHLRVAMRKIPRQDFDLIKSAILK